MTLLDQFLRQIGYHSFRSSIIFRRNTLKKRRDLSDSHNNSKPLRKATSGFKIPFRPIVERLCQTPAWGASIGVSQKRPTNRSALKTASAQNFSTPNPIRSNQKQPS